MRFTEEERAVFSRMGKLGIRALNAKLDKPQRAERARKAAVARWEKARRKRAAKD